MQKIHELGFTFIELLVVISVIALLSGIGIASYVSYSQKQTLSSAASDVASVLNLAKARAQSQVKPVLCTSTQSLDSYRFKICSIAGAGCINSAYDYELQVMCGGFSQWILGKKLPGGVRFRTSGQQGVFIFNTVTGDVNVGGAGSATIVFENDYALTPKTITVYTDGKIIP